MRILVFGGSGFIGAEFVHELLAAEPSAEIYVANRGHWTWDSRSRILPFVRHIYCDRNDSAPLRAELVRIHFDAVVDFSAYNVDAVRPIYASLKEANCGLYVFVSSDSIYEVAERRSDDAAPLVESDARRPADAALRDVLNRRDAYGDGKLAVEEFLRDERAKPGGIAFVVVRLPDVLGARDTTRRVWKALLWAQLADSLGVPFSVPAFARDLRTSYVYVRDAARVLVEIVRHGSALCDATFNVAWPEGKTLAELVGSLREALEAAGAATPGAMVWGDGNERVFAVPHVTRGLPSVTRGSIDTTKIARVLGERFAPTPWSTAIEEIVAFYLDAFGGFPRERNETIDELVKDLEGSLRRESHASVKRRIYEALLEPTTARVLKAADKTKEEAEQLVETVHGKTEL